MSQPEFRGLRVADVHKSYATRGEPLCVLQGVWLSLAPGESAAIVGPSGCGKSTLLAILGTLERPTSGSVVLDGEDPFALRATQLAAFRNRRVGFVFQEHHLLPHLNVLENVLSPTLGSSPSVELHDRAVALIERVGLADRIDHRPGELSGGQRQRAAIARALLMTPTLVLADEPTGSLDRRLADETAELLLELPAREGAALVIATHSERLAERVARRYELCDGRLAALGA